MKKTYPGVLLQQTMMMVRVFKRALLKAMFFKEIVSVQGSNLTIKKRSLSQSDFSPQNSLSFKSM
jgi:hypothetical protein